MSREHLLTELQELSAAFGPSGHEDAVAEIFRRSLAGIAECRRDRLGSAIAALPGVGPRVMLAAHLDEVGLMVKAVSAEGCLRFVTLGRWSPQVLPGCGVRVRGRSGEVRGVIGSRPPHFVREEEHNRLVPTEEMHIDIGAGSRAGAAEMGINPGDPVVPDVTPGPLAGGEIFLGKALDDRVGTLALLEAVKRLAQTGHPNTILAAGTVQEEIGARGARTAAQMLHPDLCLVIEGSPADDFPGMARELVQGGLGLGPQIRLFDPSMVGNRPLIDLAVAEARSLGLPYQVAVRENGGTDGGPIHLTDTGVPTMVIGIPVRYAHSQAGLCSLSDLEHAIELLVALVQRLDAETAGAC